MTATVNPDIKHGSWTEAEEEFIAKEVQKAIDANKRPSWAKISSALHGRTDQAVPRRCMRILNPEIKRGQWTKAEDSLLVKLAQTKVDEKGYPHWAEIARDFEVRPADDVMKHYLRKLNPSIHRGPWTKAEDALLGDLVRTCVDDNRQPQWARIATYFEGRTPGAVRVRWMQSLSPEIRRGRWTKTEDDRLIELASTMLDEEGRQQWAEIKSFSEDGPRLLCASDI